MSQFPTLGVKVSFLRDFINLYKDVFEYRPEIMTAEVVMMIIKPATMEFSQSFCEMLQAQGHQSVGIANVFVSHAWGDPFLTLVQKLENPNNFYFLDQQYDRHQDTTIVWLDIFSIRQNESLLLDSEWFRTVFGKGIAQIKNTVFVLTPTSMTRGWCIWELYSTIRSKSSFRVALSSHPIEYITSLYVAWQVDTENCHCNKEEDLNVIRENIKLTIGFEAVNREVRYLIYYGIGLMIIRGLITILFLAILSFLVLRSLFNPSSIPYQYLISVTILFILSNPLSLFKGKLLGIPREDGLRFFHLLTYSMQVDSWGVKSALVFLSLLPQRGLVIKSIQLVKDYYSSYHRFSVLLEYILLIQQVCHYIIFHTFNIHFRLSIFLKKSNFHPQSLFIAILYLIFSSCWKLLLYSCTFCADSPILIIFELLTQRDKKCKHCH